MGCGEFLVKYILFFANLFFALAGLTLLGLGIAVEMNISEVVHFLENNQLMYMASISAMVIGSLVFIVAFFGCCGAIRESNCLLVTYSIFMILLMIINVVLAILLFVKLDDFVDEIPRWLNEAFNRDRTAFQQLEKSFHCCGPNGASSYGNLMLSDTCCASPPCLIIGSAYPSCSGILGDFFQTFGVVIGAIAIGVAAIELVAVVFGLCLANHVRNKYRRSAY